MAAGTSVPYFASRLWIRNLGAVPNGNASRNCWMIQALVGYFVRLKCRRRRRSWLMTKKQLRTPKVIVGTVKKSMAAIASPVIRKKGAPALGRLGIFRRPLHPAGDGSLGDVKAQHEQFAVNARRAPGWVLRHHAEDQFSNFC